MEADAKMAEHRVWQTALNDALTPLLGDKLGIVCMRVFYAVRHANGDLSIGQAGLTPQDEIATGHQLIAAITTVLRDPEGNHGTVRIDVPGGGKQ
jgi:hypothetical protein